MYSKYIIEKKIHALAHFWRPNKQSTFQTKNVQRDFVFFFVIIIFVSEWKLETYVIYNLKKKSLNNVFVLFRSSIVRGAHVTSSRSPLPFKLKLLLFPAVESSGCLCVFVCDTPAAPSGQQRQTADDEPLGDI